MIEENGPCGYFIGNYWIWNWNSNWSSSGFCHIYILRAQGRKGISDFYSFTLSYVNQSIFYQQNIHCFIVLWIILRVPSIFFGSSLYIYICFNFFIIFRSRLYLFSPFFLVWDWVDVH